MERLPEIKPHKHPRNRRRGSSNAVVYAGSSLFVFMAARIVVANDPGFQSRSPLWGYAAAFAAAFLAFIAEYIRDCRHRKDAGGHTI